MDRLITLGLSDCHLGQTACPISDNLLALLSQYQNRVDTLIIAGDLFEVWLGNDLASDHQWSIADSIREVQADQSIFIPGNRDFLISDEWLERAGLTQADQFVHHGWTWAHGDEFCTSDTDYMAWRAQCRAPAFAEHFLSLSADERLSMAKAARSKSQARGAQTASQIADVTPSALPTGRWIHGHTHRPAVHHTGTTARAVLGDWRPDAWVWVESHQHTGLAKWDQGWVAQIPLA